MGSTLTINFYINGVLDGPYTSNQTAISNGGSSKILYLGEQGECLCNYLQGQIDEVRIWDDVRTQTEIKNNMNTELTGSESNLVAYYNFNGGRGTSLMDVTTNNNMGTLTNMASSSDWVTGVTFQTSALSIYGESTTTSSSHVSKIGAIGSGSGLDANGQIKN